MGRKRIYETTRGMNPFIPGCTTANGPEAIIREKIKDKLEKAGWIVEITHGNAWQSGFPDLYLAHVMYGQKWVEVKNPGAWSFTPAQMRKFPAWVNAGVGIWVLFADTDEEIMKLRKPANFQEIYTLYLLGVKR